MITNNVYRFLIRILQFTLLRARTIRTFIIKAMILVEEGQSPPESLRWLLQIHDFISNMIDVECIRWGGGVHIKHELMNGIHSFFYKRIPPGSCVLDIGCGKGFLLYELSKLLPKAEVCGIDISEYAVENCKEELRNVIQVGNAIELPFEENSFDFVFALGCMHNLYNYELFDALKEMERVGKQHKYTMQESYRNETERINMCNWQLTQHSFYSTQEWVWFMNMAGYRGDYGFIFFE